MIIKQQINDYYRITNWCGLNAKRIIQTQWKDDDFVKEWNKKYKSVYIQDVPNGSYTTFFTYIGYLPDKGTYILGYNKNDYQSYMIFFEYDITQDKMVSLKPITKIYTDGLKVIATLWPNVIHIKCS